jgi:RHS repeat-associated protein
VVAPTAGGSTDGPDWGFTSQRYEKAARIYDYNARWYDPEIGRFLQPDAIVASPFVSQSLNRYSYVMNDPVNYVDSTGHVGTSFNVQLPGLFGGLGLANLGLGNLGNLGGLGSLGALGGALGLSTVGGSGFSAPGGGGQYDNTRVGLVLPPWAKGIVVFFVGFSASNAINHYWDTWVSGAPGGDGPGGTPEPGGGPGNQDWGIGPDGKPRPVGDPGDPGDPNPDTETESESEGESDSKSEAESNRGWPGYPQGNIVNPLPPIKF